MSLETLLEAAKFLELQELREQRIANRGNRTQSFSRVEEEPYRNGHATHVERERTSSLSERRAPPPLDDHHPTLHPVPEDMPLETTRRHTNSSSLGPCILRSGTREVHNKLEKNRRAHLKECFEMLKRQLPATPDEKKTSNLSILGSAIRFIQILKRREREYEHEMERLAREKIAGQQRLKVLKNELSAQWEHIDFSTLIPDEPVVNINVCDRETPQEPAGLRIGARYSSSSSLSSAATAPSPSTATSNSIQATLSMSPTSILTLSTSPSLITSGQTTQQQNNIQPKTISPVMIASTHNTATIKRDLNTNHVFTNNKQIQNNTINSTLLTNGHVISTQNISNNQNRTRLEPPSLKLVNGTTSLAVTQLAVNSDEQKSIKVHPTQITLSQVMGNGGGLVVSPIQLLTSQNIRVLGGTQGSLAAIEIATSATSQRLRDSTITTSAQLHKLLVPQGAPPPETPLGGRLPGGAELNLLPKVPPTLYRPAKGLTILNTLKTTGDGTNGRAVHMVTPLSAQGAPLSGLTPLMVSQGQGGPVAHIIATPSQLAGKMVSGPLLKPVTSGMPIVSAQYLSTALVKPIVVMSNTSQVLSQSAPTTSSG